jgi:hypothetical protein
MKLQALLFVFYFFFTSYSQDLNVFNENKSDLTNFYESSDVVANQTLDDKYGRLTRSEGFTVLKTVKEGASFSRSLHESGKVIFNAEATKYLNEIKSQLLIDYPLIDNIITIHAVESNSLNAFATANNRIYVNTGLLAYVENEAQLAYILSHELMHIVNTHIISESLETKEKLKYDKGDLGSKEDFIQVYRHSLSRSNETEADVDGLTLFLKQNYKVNEAYKALELLANHNSLMLGFSYSPAILLTDSSSFQEIVTFGKETKESEKKTDSSFRTHPLIEDRLEKLTTLLNKNSTTNEGKSFLVSEPIFNIIKKQARAKFQSIYANDLDFINLFALSSYKYTIEGDSSEENLNFLAYSIQGLLIDKFKSVELTSYKASKKNVLTNFYNLSSKFEFTKWVLKALTSLEQENHSTFPKAYLEKAKLNVLMSDFSDDKKITLVGDTSLKTKDKGNNKIKFSELSFDISPYNDITSKMKKSMTETVGGIEEEGNLAVLSYNNVRIKKSPRADTYSTGSFFTLDQFAIEKADFKSKKAWHRLSEDYDTRLEMLIPNKENYSSVNYTNYKVLNKWLNVRLYNEGFEYVYLNQKKVDAIINSTDIRYVLVGMNIEIKAYSLKKFFGAYFSMIPLLHYSPQMFANIFISKVRKNQLALVFNLSSKEVVFWDKRTHLEPNSSEQFYITFNNVLKKFNKK